MNRGQFYKAEQLVAAVHRDGGGIFGGFRAAGPKHGPERRSDSRWKFF